MAAVIRRTEYPHHTREQIEGYMTTALELVGTLEVDGPLRDALVLRAVDLLAAKQIVNEQRSLGAGVALPGQPH